MSEKLWTVKFSPRGTEVLQRLGSEDGTEDLTLAQARRYIGRRLRERFSGRPGRAPGKILRRGLSWYCWKRDGSDPYTVGVYFLDDGEETGGE